MQPMAMLPTREFPQYPIPQQAPSAVLAAGLAVPMEMMQSSFQTSTVSLTAEHYDQLYKSAMNCENYRQTLESRDQELSDLREELKTLQKNYSSTKTALENHLTQLESARLEVENDNISLRSYITSMRAPQEQLRDDAYYTDKLQGLNRMIQSWIAGIFISNCRSLTPEAGRRLLEIISGLDPYGRATESILSDENKYDDVWTLHQDPTKRVALARHIIALFLWRYIFGPLAFGLKKEDSLRMRDIEKKIISNGLSCLEWVWADSVEPDFQKALFICQAFHKAILSQVKDKQMGMKQTLARGLSESLGLLLPKKMDLETGLQQIVDQAVTLANQMTEERALFYCLMVQTGNNPQEYVSTLRVADERQSGAVFMCTFPGFGKRTVDENGEKCFVCLVKMSADLESLFVRKQG